MIIQLIKSNVFKLCVLRYLGEIHSLRLITLGKSIYINSADSLELDLQCRTNRTDSNADAQEQLPDLDTSQQFHFIALANRSH